MISPSDLLHPSPANFGTSGAWVSKLTRHKRLENTHTNTSMCLDTKISAIPPTIKILSFSQTLQENTGTEYLHT